jgi:hypothetical protein
VVTAAPLARARLAVRYSPAVCRPEPCRGKWPLVGHGGNPTAVGTRADTPRSPLTYRVVQYEPEVEPAECRAQSNGVTHAAGKWEGGATGTAALGLRVPEIWGETCASGGQCRFVTGILHHAQVNCAAVTRAATYYSSSYSRLSGMYHWMYQMV